MASPIFDFAYELGGNAPAIREQTAGGAIAKGDPLVVSSGKLIKKTGGTDTVQVKYVAASAAAADGDKFLAIAAMPSTVFRATKSGTPTAGGQYGLTSSTLLPDGTNTTQKMVQVVNQDDADSTIVEVVFIGWIA